jgi:hypothetical protein
MRVKKQISHAGELHQCTETLQPQGGGAHPEGWAVHGHFFQRVNKQHRGRKSFYNEETS